MAFDLESLGGGFITGLIGAITGVLGINHRVNKIEDSKQDKSYCSATHKGIDEKFEIMVDLQKEIRERINGLNDYVKNKRQ